MKENIDKEVLKSLQEEEAGRALALADYTKLTQSVRKKALLLSRYGEHAEAYVQHSMLPEAEKETLNHFFATAISNDLMIVKVSDSPKKFRLFPASNGSGMRTFETAYQYRLGGDWKWQIDWALTISGETEDAVLHCIFDQITKSKVEPFRIRAGCYDGFVLNWSIYEWNYEKKKFILLGTERE